jgi:hypothetical protein
MTVGCHLSSSEDFRGFPEGKIRSPSDGGRAIGPGCLTSEDEERETWTAESLRVSITEGFGLQVLRLDERLRRYTFIKVTPSLFAM